MKCKRGHRSSTPEFPNRGYAHFDDLHHNEILIGDDDDRDDDPPIHSVPHPLEQKHVAISGRILPQIGIDMLALSR